MAKAWSQQLISDLIVQRTEVFTGDVTPPQITADQNNYNPTSLSLASALRLSTDASRTLTGLAGGSDGRKLRLYNVGSFDVVLANENAASTAANRFALGSAVTLAPNRGVELQYDSTSARWRAVGSPAQTAGTGTVTDFSAGDMAPLFTTTEATTTTTPALTFALTAAAQNAVLAGPTVGAGAPAYRALVAADIPALSSTYQPLDSDLTSIAALATTAFGRGLLTEATAATTRTTLGLVIGTDVQAQNANLAGLAGLTSAADRLPYFSGAGGATSLTTFTTYARTLLDDVDAGTARATLGLGTMAVAATADYSTTTVINGWFNDPTGNGSFTAANWRAGLGLPGYVSADPGATDIFPFWNDATNLVNWQSAAATRTALALGPAALMSVGTGAGTLAAGDDSRITGAAQKASNLSDLQSASVSRTNLGLGTMAVQNASAVAITGGSISGIAWLFGNTGLKIEDTDASHLLTLAPGSNLTANRTLTITTGDANRTVTLTGDTSLTGTNTGDQTITLTGGVTGSGTGSFAATVITNANLTGHVTSTGNAAVLGSFTVAQLNTALSDGDVSTGGGTATGTNTGDQTSIAGITGTIAQFNTALSDGDFATLAGAETLTNKVLTAPDINAGTADSLTSLSFRSSGAAFDLTFASSEAITAGRILSWNVGDAARTVTISGNPTLADWFDQSVKAAASPTFVTVTAALSGNATTATTLTTPRAIYGNNFDGSAALAQVIASTYGGTGNGFAKFSGPATTEKIYTLPNSSETLLYAGGPISGTTGTFTNDMLVTGAGALAYRLTRGSVTALWQNGVAQTYFGTSSNHPVEVLVNNATVGTFSTTGLAVTGTLAATGETTAGSNGTTGAAWLRMGGTLAAKSGVDISDSSNSSGAGFLQFRNGAGTGIGSIARVTTTDAVAYNTTSDARLKTNIRDFTGADSGAIIDALRPRWFDWKASDLTETVESVEQVEENGETVEKKALTQVKVTDPARRAQHVSDSASIIGFIAQEEAAVDPVLARIGAVTVGDADPTTITKQWQRSDAALVPILVAELKALRARVAALETANVASTVTNSLGGLSLIALLALARRFIP